jgi:hypothetical protein
MQKSLTIVAIEEVVKKNDLHLNEKEIELIAEKVGIISSYSEGVAKDAAYQFQEEYKNHLITANLLEESRANTEFQTRLANDFRERLIRKEQRQRRTDNFVFFLIIVILFGAIIWGVKMHS